MSQDILTAISDAVGTEVFGIWFLIGAALVFFMPVSYTHLTLPTTSRV